MTFGERLQAWLELRHWKTYWKVPEGVTLTVPKGDYRDRLPTRPEDIAEQYASVVRDGYWTLGLVECWGKRSKVIKSSVHVPCCPSFRFMPWRWRGICFGRTLAECFFFGCQKGRWARTVHALNIGREYSDPFEGLGRAGHETADEVACLCCFDQWLSVILGLGIGLAISVAGNCGVNFSACYTCHAREKLRRKYNLPPTFGLPPGVDDCVVHFICFYCASHQELRESVMRGLDGPGISPLDVWSKPWAHVEGFAEECEYRRQKLELLREQGHLFLPFEQRLEKQPGLAVRTGRLLREYHYRKLGLDAPEHGKGHFHHPRRNYRAARQAKRVAASQDGSQLPEGEGEEEEALQEVQLVAPPPQQMGAAPRAPPPA